MLDNARIEALKVAIEGECDGLAITDGQARAILEYMDGATEPIAWKVGGYITTKRSAAEAESRLFPNMPLIALGSLCVQAAK